MDTKEAIGIIIDEKHINCKKHDPPICKSCENCFAPEICTKCVAVDFLRAQHRMPSFGEPVRIARIKEHVKEMKKSSGILPTAIGDIEFLLDIVGRNV